jgi:hypothetical protein
MNRQPSQDQTNHYEFKVEGQLNPTWSAWFEDLTLIHEASGNTTLTGSIADQAALHGVLIKIRDLGLTLISVKRLKKSETGTNND